MSVAKTHTTVAFSAYNATVMINKVSRATFLSDFIAEEGQEALFGDISGRKRSPGGMLTYSNLRATASNSSAPKQFQKIVL